MQKKSKVFFGLLCFTQKRIHYYGRKQYWNNI